MSERRERTVAEWVSLGASLAVLAAIVVVLLTGFGDASPAEPVAVVREHRRAADDAHHVIVEVTNDGGRAAASVQVTATLRLDDEEQTGDQIIDFLGADETSTVVFVFADDPAEGTLTVDVTGFAVP